MPPREEIFRADPGIGRAAALPLASDEAFGAGVGRGIGQLGGAMHEARVRAIARETERERDAANAQAGADYAAYAEEVSILANTKREEALPGAPGHVETVANELNARRDRFLESITDERVRQRWAVRVAEFNARVIADEDGWARGRRVENEGDNVRKGGEGWDNQLLGAPDVQSLTRSYEAALDAGETTIAALAERYPAVAGKLRDEWINQRGHYFAKGLMRLDPAAALEMLVQGAVPLDPKDREQLIGQAQAAAHSQEIRLEREQRMAAAQARDYLDVLGKRFADADPTISDEDLEQAQQIATSLGDAGKAYDIAKWRTWKAVDDAFRGASALQLSNAIRELDGKIEREGDKGSPDDVIRRDRLQVLLTRRQAEEDSDPLATVETAPLVPGDVGSLRRRVSSANAALEETGRYAFFTPQELPLLQEQLASGPNGRLEVVNLLAQVASVDPQAALRAASQIDAEDGTLRHALRLGPQAREMVVRGAAARETLPKHVIGPEGRSASLDTITGTWFAENAAPALVRSQPEFVDDVLETARALYADWRRRFSKAGQDEEFRPDQFARAVNIALGGQGHGRGGIGRWQQGPKGRDGEGRPFVVPSGLTEHEVERRFANPVIVAGTGKAPPGAVNGSPVWSNEKPMSLADLTRKFVPVAIADGIYQFHSGGRVVMTADHRPFQVDIRRVQPPAERSEERARPRRRMRSAWEALPPPTSDVRGPVWIAPPPGGE